MAAVASVPAPHAVVFACAEEPHGVLRGRGREQHAAALRQHAARKARHRHVREAQHREYRPSPRPRVLRMLHSAICTPS